MRVSYPRHHGPPPGGPFRILGSVIAGRVDQETFAKPSDH
jgi:hypothetical protein